MRISETDQHLPQPHTTETSSLPAGLKRKEVGKTAVHVSLIFFILFGISWYFISTLTFFAPDTGLRYMQIQSLVENNSSTLAIDYWARTLDPDLAYIPFYYAYSVVDGEIFFQISAFLPVVTAWLYSFLGTMALPVIPVVGGVLTATAVFYMGKITKVKRPYLLLWTTVFATPLFFYSLELWDHSIAAACTLWAMVGFARSLQTSRWQPAFYGGLALGIGLGQRPEIYVYAIALGFAALLVSWKQWRILLALVAGSFLTATSVWLLQWRWTGHPLGMTLAPHLFKYGIPDSSPLSFPGYPRNITLSRFILYVQGKDEIIFIAALLILIGIFLTIFSVRIPRWQKTWVLWLAFGMTVSGFFLMIWRTWGQPLPGILSTFPLIALSLIYLDKKQDKTTGRQVYLLSLITVLIFLGLMIAVWPAAGGIQWGARYLLPAYPLFVFLAFYVVTIEDRWLTGSYLRTFQRVAAGLLIITILLQGYSVLLLHQKHQSEIKLRDAINNLSADLILTNNPFLPSAMASLNTKQFLYIDDAEDLQTLIPRLSDEDIDYFALVTIEPAPIVVPSQVGDIVVVQIDTLIYALDTVPEPGAKNE